MKQEIGQLRTTWPASTRVRMKSSRLCTSTPGPRHLTMPFVCVRYGKTHIVMSKPEVGFRPSVAYRVKVLQEWFSFSREIMLVHEDGPSFCLRLLQGYIITKGCVGLSIFLFYVSTESCLKWTIVVAAQSHWSCYGFSIEGGWWGTMWQHKAESLKGGRLVKLVCCIPRPKSLLLNRRTI